MNNDEEAHESASDTGAISERIPRESLEEEFETIEREFKQRSESKDFETRSREMWTQFARHNPAYMPVLNGHVLIEGLLDQLLFESIKHPNCLRDNYSFAERLNILQSVSPLPSTSLIWKLLSKLNTLRNVVAHGSDHKKLSKLLQEIQSMIRKSKLRTDMALNRPGLIITYAFAMASFDLDLLISTTRLRNRVQRLWEKLGTEHPLAVKTFSLLRVLDVAVTHDIV
jgi:hypothetical protein